MPIPPTGPMSLKSQGTLIKTPFWDNTIKQQGFPFHTSGLPPLTSKTKAPREKCKWDLFLSLCFLFEHFKSSQLCSKSIGSSPHSESPVKHWTSAQLPVSCHAGPTDSVWEGEWERWKIFSVLKQFLQEQVQVRNPSEWNRDQVQPEHTEKEQPFTSQSFYYALR